MQYGNARVVEEMVFQALQFITRQMQWTMNAFHDCDLGINTIFWKKIKQDFFLHWLIVSLPWKEKSKPLLTRNIFVMQELAANPLQGTNENEQKYYIFDSIFPIINILACPLMFIS